MSKEAPSFTLDSEHGLISIADTALKNEKPALLLIHGNSSSSNIWRHMVVSEQITKRWRVITFDLPGHGASSNAPDPDKSYSMRGYAELGKEILEHLNVESVVVLGWSLGGHVGIEMIPLLAKSEVELKGLMIVGTPPALGIEQVNQGFLLQDAHMSLPGRRDWTEEETKLFARSTAGELFEQWMEEDARRTDGRAREKMFSKFGGGDGLDQRKEVETNENVPIAVVNGGAEPYVNLDYLDEIRWKRLWKGKCFRLEGLKHAPFWERPTMFEEVLVEFMVDCEA